MQSLLNVTTVLSVLLILMVLFSVRREHIRVEYSVSWLLAAVTMLLLSRARPALDYITTHAGIPDTPLTLFLVAGSVFLIMFFRFSIIISHLRDDNIALAQRVAILEFYLHEVKNPTRTVKAQKAAAAPPSNAWLYWAAGGAAFVAVFWAYGPALHGPFLFDDTALPFRIFGMHQPLSKWLSQVRQMLMFTYWLNAQMSGENTYSYHVANVVMHCITSGMIYLSVRKVLQFARVEEARRGLLAALSAGIFLLHPVQTEGVAYLAGRSEVLSVMFAFAAFTLFLYRKSEAVTWGEVAAIFVLFGAALLSKEHTIILPALLMLTDYWWNPGFSFAGVKKNFRLYLPMAVGAAFGVFWFRSLILGAETAGFAVKDLTWYQYFFTQCRALFVYLRIFVLPVNLNADYDYPISRTLFDGGAAIGLVVLVALAAAAWFYRRRFPIASYGFFVFLVLIAPTSSFLPIKDPLADRRLYFPMLGLLLIVADVVNRLELKPKMLAAVSAAVCLLAAVATHARAAVWSDPLLLWQDTTAKSPGKSRPHFQFASAYYDQGQYDRAIAEFEKAAQTGKADYNLLVDWGLAYDGMGREDEALAKFRQAQALENTAHVWTQIAMVDAKQGHWDDAMAALDKAEGIDPQFAMTYVYKGKIHLAKNELGPAITEYQRALGIDPTINDAVQDLLRARQLLMQSGGH